MARLFSLMNASAIDDPVYGHFEPHPDHGGFDLPDELADQIHPVHFRKRRAWESEIERDERLHGEESARRRDPETLYNAVAGIADIAGQIAGLRSASPQDAEVAELAGQVEALKARLAAMEGQAPAAEDGGSDDTGAEDAGTAGKPSRTRKAAPARA